MTPHRKAPDVRDALRALPVPDHADDFFDRLKASLTTDAPAPPGSAVTELAAVRLARSAPPRRLRRFLTLATAPAAAVACFVLVVGVGLLARDEGERSGEGANRLTVPVELPKATRGLHVRFTKTETTNGTGQSHSYDAVISPNGDYKMTRLASGLDVVYDSTTGVRTMQGAEPGQPVEYVAQSDVPPGPPDTTGLSQPDASLSRDLGAALRAIAAERPSDVREITYRGRRALELVWQEEIAQVPFDSQRLVVDKDTGYPLLLTQKKAGALYREMKVELIEETGLGEHEFAVSSTSMATLNRAPNDRSLQFVTTAMPDVGSAVGYKPLVPTRAPRGYALATVKVAASVDKKSAQRNPRSRDVVTLLYRKGFDTFTVTTRRATGAAGTYAPWVDPITDGSFTGRVQTETAYAGSGALAGVPLNIGVNALDWPHVWAQSDALVVTVAGDLTRAELLDVTSSLEEYAPPSS